jgi:hypothetical protein
MLSSKLILLASGLVMTSVYSFELQPTNGEFCFNENKKTGWVTTCKKDIDDYQLFANNETPANYRPDKRTKYDSGVASIGHVYLYGANEESGSFAGYPDQKYDCPFSGPTAVECN